jgi:hypothetical protein
MQRAKAGLTGENETDEQYQAPATGGMLWGALNSGAHLVGNVLDMIQRPDTKGYIATHPGATEEEATAALTDTKNPGNRMAAHMKDAADWLRSGGQPEGFWQNVGAVGEQVLEYIGTDGLLKMVGPAAGTAEAAEHLKQAQQVAQVVKANPKIAGLLAVGLKAAKDATLMGAQTYGHTLDPGQAAEAAAFGGAGRTAGEAAGAAGRALLKRAPQTLKIAGEEIPALAEQVNDAGEPTGASAAGAPKIAEAQQEGAQAVLGNTARQGAGNALTWLNLYGNRTANAAAEAVPQLAAPEGAEPFTFRLEGPPTKETPTGEIAHSAAQEPRAAFKDPRFKTGSAPTRTAEIGGTGRIIPGAEGGTGADIRTGTAPEARGETVGGGGALTTANPHEAQAWLQQLDDLRQSPTYDSLSTKQQGLIDDQYKALEEQLGLYHASPYVQRFSPADVTAAVGQVNTFGDAAAQVQAAAKPIYETLDRVSGGDFTKFNGQVKQAQQVIRSATSMEAVESAQVRLSEANEAINNLMTRHASEISPTDYRAAKSAWRDSMTLSNLHNVTERMMNGITSEESAQGLPRIMTGRTRALEAWLGQGTNRADAERLIGQEGVSNLKRITLLLSNAGTARAASGVAKETMLEMGRHVGRGGMGAMAGAAVAHLAGADPWTGALTGAALADGMRYVMRQAATNPNVGKLLDFAARNHLSPQHYAPLIARAIATPFQEQQTPQQGNREQETDEEHGAAYDTGPQAGKPIDGMLQRGNIDVNHRPSIRNFDGSHSSIFSMTIPLDKSGQPWNGKYENAPQFALVPTIADGRFLTPNGKIPRDYKNPRSEEMQRLQDRATDQYIRTGQHLGIFTSDASASAYADRTHAYMNDGTDRKVFAPSVNQEGQP